MVELDRMPRGLFARGYVCCQSPEAAAAQFMRETGKEPVAYYKRNHKLGFTTIYIYNYLPEFSQTDDKKHDICHYK